MLARRERGMLPSSSGKPFITLTHEEQCLIRDRRACMIRRYSLRSRPSLSLLINGHCGRWISIPAFTSLRSHSPGV